MRYLEAPENERTLIDMIVQLQFTHHLVRMAYTRTIFASGPPEETKSEKIYGKRLRLAQEQIQRLTRTLYDVRRMDARTTLVQINLAERQIVQNG